MECYYGRGTLSTDKTSDEFIHVNNFGFNKCINENFCVKRKDGRVDYQIMYIDKGYGHILLNGEFIKAESGSVIILPPFEKNHYEFPAKSLSDYYWIHFTGVGVPQLLEKLQLQGGIFNVGDFYEFRDSIVSMSKVAAIEDFTTDSYLSSCIYMLLSQLSKRIYVPKNPLHKVLTYMQNNNINSLSNNDCAQMCGLSEYHFIRTFKSITGTTPHRYMAKITVNKAIELMTDTNLNISEIARMLGFEDSLYFSRFFKKEIGCSPKNYMKENKSKI